MDKIIVRENAGLLDSLQSAGRSLLVVIGAVPVLLGLLGSHNFGAIVEYFKGSDGASLIAAVSALIAFGYGVYKSHKRGGQVVHLADRVSNSIAEVK